MIETKRDSKKGIIFHTCSGEVGFKDMVDCVREGAKQPDFSEFPSTVWMFRKARFVDSTESMAALLPFVRDLTSDSGSDRKIAWITKSPTARQVLEEFFRSQAWTSDWRIFEDKKAAVDWCS